MPSLCYSLTLPSECEMESAPPPPPTTPLQAEQLAPTSESLACTPSETRPPSAALSTTSRAGSMLPPRVQTYPAPPLLNGQGEAPPPLEGQEKALPSLDVQEKALPSVDGQQEALSSLNGQADPQPSLDGQEDAQLSMDGQEEPRPTSTEDVLSVPPSESLLLSQQPPKRKHSDNASAPGQLPKNIMDLKYKEHELDMEIKRTEQQCALMEKELKQLNLEMVKMESEAKGLEIKVLNLSLTNKEIQTETFQNELENSVKMTRVLDVWENTATAVQTAANRVIEYLNELKS